MSVYLALQYHEIIYLYSQFAFSFHIKITQSYEHVHTILTIHNMTALAVV